MTTVSLELSRQLQERWPELQTSFWWHKPGVLEWSIDCGHMPLPVDFYKEQPDKFCPAFTLDELRVFALELIEANPKYDDVDKQHMKGKLAFALIQGCDATAEFILKAFGGK